MIWLTAIQRSPRGRFLDIQGYQVQPNGDLRGPYTWTREAIIDNIQTGIPVYTARADPRSPDDLHQGAEVILINTPNGPALRTRVEGTEANNLGGLPHA